MTVREYLERYREAERLARLSRIEYQKELDLIDAVRSPLAGDGTGHGSGISKTTENKALRLADRAREVQRAEAEALQIMREVYDVIRKVPGNPGDVLYERYINLKSWEEVAKAIKYSKRQAHRFHDEGLSYLQDVIEWHSET